jgi:hypothetical protein
MNGLNEVKAHLRNGGNILFNDNLVVAQVNYSLSNERAIFARFEGQKHFAMLMIRDLKFVK